MGFQILPQAQPRQASLGKRFSNAVGAGLESGAKLMKEYEQKQDLIKENATSKELGIDLSGIKDPKTRQQMFALAMQGKNQKELESAKDINYKENQSALFEHQKELQNTKPKVEKAPPGGLGGIPIPKEKANVISKIVKENPNATAEQLELLFNEAEIEPGHTSKLLESRRRTEETKSKSNETKDAQLRAETLPLKKEIVDKARAAAHGIQNKEHLLDLIHNGNIDDPTYAAIAEALPLNLGKRLLSNDTVEYKGGLIEEFGDLKNLFKGATRVKELELLEQKIADIYLTDSQKEAILKSRINALQGDVIIAEVAAEMEAEGKNYPLLTYQTKLDKRTKPRLDSLFNRILDEHQSVIKSAEVRKQTPLDINDPEDKKIMLSILKEAGGDKLKAKELTKKKGYTVKGVK